jgi:hypothetical protein
MGRVIDTLVDYVKAGTIKHFFLVGGCDGAKPGRNHYSDFVDKAPQDTVILTLACGKFRFFDHDLGAIDGVPRLIDVGQCNDAYSAVVVASALSDALGKEISDLPSVWLSGGRVMQMTGAAYYGSALFWLRLVVEFGLGLAVLGVFRKIPIWLPVLLLAGEILGRIMFFTHVVHSAVNIGNLY